MSTPENNTPAPEVTITGNERRTMELIADALYLSPASRCATLCEQEGVKELRAHVAAEVARATAEKRQQRFAEWPESARQAILAVERQYDIEVVSMAHHEMWVRKCDEKDAEIARLKEAARHHRWNIEERGTSLFVCRGQHERSEDCAFDEYVPAPERDALQAQVRVLRGALTQIRKWADSDEYASWAAGFESLCNALRETTDSALATSTGEPTEKDAEEWRDAPTPPAVIAEWRKDKERLDWLSAQLKPGCFYTIHNHNHASQFFGAPPPEWSPETPIGLGEFPEHFGDTLRAAIDAAVQESRKERA